VACVAIRFGTGSAPQSQFVFFAKLLRGSDIDEWHFGNEFDPETTRFTLVSELYDAQ
jgi:hypothetical protein